MFTSFKPGVRNLRPACRFQPAKQNHPVRSPIYQIAITVYGHPSSIIFYESALLLHCAVNVLYEAFWAFVTNCENQKLIWLKFHKFPTFNNSNGNGIVAGNLLLPAIPCRVCFWPATGERLPAPDLTLLG